VNIICPHCKTKLNIPDHRIPKNRDTSFKCPKCQGRVQVAASQLKQPALNPDALTVPGSGAPKEESSKKEFLGPGILSAGGQEYALVCMDDSPGKMKVVDAVKGAGFHVESPVSISEAFIKMAYHIYPLILLDESFDRNRGFKAMSIHMNELDMAMRRRICLVLVSDRLPTGDPMSALHSSVNFIVGSDSLDHVDDILSTALMEHKNLYTVYNESMKAAGKA